MSRPWHAMQMTTSPPMKDGAIAPSTSSLCSALRLGSGTARLSALLISAAATASFVHPAALNMMAWAKPIFHRSAVVRHLGKAKSHGSSSPGGASSGLGASRGIAWPSRVRSGGAEGLPRGVRSDADIGRARIICPGFRLDWIMFGESGGAVGHEVVTTSFSGRQISPHVERPRLSQTLRGVAGRGPQLPRALCGNLAKELCLVRRTPPSHVLPARLDTLQAVFI